MKGATMHSWHPLMILCTGDVEDLEEACDDVSNASSISYSGSTTSTHDADSIRFSPTSASNSSSVRQLSE